MILLNLMAIMISSMVFHELGHWLVYNSHYRGKAYTVFEKTGKGYKLYTDVKNTAVKADIVKSSIAAGVALGFLPIIIYGLADEVYLMLGILYLWMSRHDFINLWRLRSK